MILKFTLLGESTSSGGRMFSSFAGARSIASIALAIAASAAVSVWISRATPAAAQGQPARGGGSGRRGPVPDDTTGFQPIFDGKTLNNWDGDPRFWRVEDGVLTGESTPEKTVKPNTFIIWRGGTTRDFELKIEFKLSAGANSGVQYRSAPLPDAGQWVLKGYQADMDGKDAFTGMLYEERARGFLAQRGQFVRMAEGGTPKLIGSPGEPDALKALIKNQDWNQLHIIARGNIITHVINGRVMSMFIDEDSKGRSAEGLLGLQLHMGPPMKVEFRNILLRQL